MSQFAVTLTPNKFDERTKALTLSEPTWKRAVALVDRAGYRGNHHVGLDRRSASYFALLLREAVSREKFDRETAKELTDLLAFLGGVGAGGFSLTRGFKKWNA